MDCFDIGVSTALWEGLPQSLVQLRLKKKAVVASDIPGNREVIRDGENGFLLPVAEHERFADAILRLAADAGLRRRLGDFAGEDFSEWSADGDGGAPGGTVPAPAGEQLDRELSARRGPANEFPIICFTFFSRPGTIWTIAGSIPRWSNSIDGGQDERKQKTDRNPECAAG